MAGRGTAMKPHDCLLVLALTLAAAPALAQGKASAVITVLGAEMGASCKDGDTARARQLDAACSGKPQCRFTPQAGDAAAEACARDSVALWNCGDGKTRQVALAPAPGQSREIRLECPQAATVATAAAPEPAQDKTETIHVQHAPGTTAPPPRPVIDMSAAGINQERLRMVCENWYDPAAPENPGASLARLHADLWKRPDHSANAVGAARQCGAKTDVPESAIPVP